MCGRFGLFCSPRALKKEFNLDEEPRFEKMYNIPPGKKIPVVGENPARSSRSAPRLMWGIKQPWQKSGAGTERLINARLETVAEKPVFKKLIAHRRCIIPASGFYEWDSFNGKKQPYWFYPQDVDVIGLAGLWRERSFLIITKPAFGKIKQIHRRMPVILPEDRYGSWLDPEENEYRKLRGMLTEKPGIKIDMHRVSPDVNSPGYDTRSCIEPV